MNVKLYVGNLPKSITSQDLSVLFSQAGDVTTIDLIADQISCAIKDFAFVTMGTQNEAQKAMHMFNSFSMDGQEIKVNIAKPAFQL